MAPNVFLSTLGQILMSVEDIGGYFSVAPPLILLLNYFKLGKMTLRGCFSVALPLILLLNYSKLGKMTL